MSGESVLDKALAKIFSLNDSLVLDQNKFDDKVNKLFDKRAVKDGIKQYLVSHGTSPRIMALVIYSTRGQELLRSLMFEHGMPSSRLYDPLMYDGSGWKLVNAPLPIYEDIAGGDETWDFMPHEWFDKVERLTAFPGTISAMVDRYRRIGRIDQVIRHMKISTMADLIEHEPAIFDKELKQLEKALIDLVNPETAHKDMAVCLVRTHLDKTEALGKVLGSKPIQRD